MRTMSIVDKLFKSFDQILQFQKKTSLNTPAFFGDALMGQFSIFMRLDLLISEQLQNMTKRSLYLIKGFYTPIFHKSFLAVIQFGSGLSPCIKSSHLTDKVQPIEKRRAASSNGSTAQCQKFNLNLPI